MARTKITPNPPSSSQNPPSKTRKVIPSSSRNPPRDPSIPSSQAERPASSRPNQPQPTPPQTSVAVRPPPDYKQLYPWATSALLGETSSINIDIDVLRLKKDTMLGKERMARLRSIAKLHNLATGSQTIPNSAAEVAAAQGRSPQVGPSPPTALPASKRKKLPLKRAKRKTPRVVSDEEEDESTEDGLICKRKRVTVAESPAAEAVGATQEQLADTQASPQPTAELPASPPHHEAPLAIQSCEGGGKNQVTTPPPTPALPAPLEEALKAYAVHLSIITAESVEKRLSKMVGEALKDSLSKYELDNRIQREEASTARAQVHKLKCDMMMKGLELSRNALKDELRCERNNNVDLRQKLNAKLTETIELESELVPQRVKITELEGALEANKAQVAKLEAKSTEVEAKRDRKAEELSKSSAELAQMHEENSGPKKKIEELDLSAAHVPLQLSFRLNCFDIYIYIHVALSLSVVRSSDVTG
ncbi:MICOS complex subunit MIC60-like [Phaseolus vulgaris]|uniref:MICOS complex subunit MIC60-like n=1 Tax=Phaseolus vulgaris TaxID=3885 RepID=UPI0035CC5B9F